MPSNNRVWQYVLFALFALSGFSGLIYESIWSHYLKLFLGHAAYAQTLVLAIFMGGMAAGAWLAGRFMSRLANPLFVYVIVELLIGVFGMLFHGVFTRTTAFMLDSVLPGMDSSLAIELVRWSFAALLILPQTLLLGATFPLVSVGLLRLFPAMPGHSISMLYFSNSLGAVAGVLISGFVLVGHIGLPGTMMTAALTNFLLALAVFIVLKRMAVEVTVPATSAEQASPLLRPLLMVALITGLSSFIYEIGWIRMLVLVLGASTHAFELMLSAFILGLALGGLWVRRRIDSFVNPLKTLAIVQLMMGLLALGTVVSYNHMFDFMQFILSALQRNEQAYLWFNLSSHLIALLVMLPVTFMAGMTLPLITYVLFRSGAGESSIGKVYAFNTLGAIIGVAIAAQLLLPYAGLKMTIMAGAVLDIFLAYYLFWRERASSRFFVAAIIVSVAALFMVGIGVRFDAGRMASGVFRHGQIQANEAIFHRDGRTATVDVTRHESGSYAIITNGKPDAAVMMDQKKTPSSDEPTMALIGALPLLAKPNAVTAAVIGMGSGISANILLSSPNIESMDLIEIESAMVEGARFFGEHSQRVFNDHRSHIHIDDAKSYFSAHDKKYDVIVSEPSNPWVSGVSNLFTDEFYLRIKHHLNDDGVLIQWFQLYETNPKLIGSILRALSNNFVDYKIYAANDTDAVLIATKQGKVPDLNGKLFDVPAFRSHMERVRMFSLDDVRLHEIGDRQLLEPVTLAARPPVNSDYFPYVDQNAVAARFKGEVHSVFFGLRSSIVPLPGNDFDGHVKTSEQMAPLYYSARERARAAQQLARYFSAAGKAPLYPVQGNVTAAMMTMGAPDCSDDVAQMIWRDNLVGLAGIMLPYLTGQEARPFVRLVGAQACTAGPLGDGNRALAALVAAVADRDMPAVEKQAMSFLGGGRVGAAKPDVYAFTALLLALHIKGDHYGVLDQLSRYDGDLSAAIQLFSAHAQVGLAQQRH
ncbi:MAG: hypothetical protein ACRERR_15145 [Moraxellaceae bacterium]